MAEYLGTGKLMDTSETSDFPVMRRTMDRLDGWVMALASPLLPLGEFPQELNGLKGFRWDFKEKTERALMVGKAVRMASGIRAALILADLGYVTECGTILRTVLILLRKSSPSTKVPQERIRGRFRLTEVRHNLLGEKLEGLG
jgi:hypothetical protein